MSDVVSAFFGLELAAQGTHEFSYAFHRAFRRQDRVMVNLLKASLFCYQGEPARASAVLEEARAVAEEDPAVQYLEIAEGTDRVRKRDLKPIPNS